MTTLREKCIRAIIEGYEEGLMADEVFDAVLAVLGEHANEWQAQAHDAWQVGPIDDDREWWDYLLAVLADPEEPEG